MPGQCNRTGPEDVRVEELTDEVKWENWPCPLVIPTTGELVRTMQKSLPYV